RTGWTCRCRWRRSGRRANHGESAGWRLRTGFWRRERGANCETGSRGPHAKRGKGGILSALDAAVPIGPPRPRAEPTPHGPMMPKRLLLAVLLTQTLFAANVAFADEESEAVLERARDLIERGEALREKAEARFRRAEVICYKVFLVNSCLSAAREKRLEMIREARDLEMAGKRLELEEKRRQAEARGAPSTLEDRPVPQPTEIPAAEPD